MAVERFLVSFLVDARGGSLCSSRHPGLRIVVPPGAAAAPIRVTCRVQRSERIARPPQLNDGEGLACRILELGPHLHRFNAPILLEVMHFAVQPSNGEREIVVLRSDNGSNWKEHTQETLDRAALHWLGETPSADGGDAGPSTAASSPIHPRVLRIVTSDFPRYFAVVTRLLQESALIGVPGGTLTSSVAPHVQCTFPENALLKKIRVALQAQPISPTLVSHLMEGDEEHGETSGLRVAFSPVVSVEPRRRKFHKPICVTISLPPALPALGVTKKSGSHHATGDQYTENLRLLCSITGGTAPAAWEDISGSTPLSRAKHSLSFTTTVSARFWLMNFVTLSPRGSPEGGTPQSASARALQIADGVYRVSNAVPYVGRFVVFGKRGDQPGEGELRCFCVTDDKVDKTLECQEGFQLCSASDELMVYHDHECWVRLVEDDETEDNNLEPLVHHDGPLLGQTRMHFQAFHENRFSLPVRVKNPRLEPKGRLQFWQSLRSSSMSGGWMGSEAADNGELSIPPNVVASRLLCTLPVRLLHASRPTSTMSLRKSWGVASISLSYGDSPRLSTGIESSELNRRMWTMDEHTHDLASSRSPLTEEDWNTVTLVRCHSVARSELDLNDIAREVNSDWPALARTLGLTRTTMQQISQDHRCDTDRAHAALMAWRLENKLSATGNELDRLLRLMGREDIIKTCMRNIVPLVAEQEIHEATRTIEQSNTVANSKPSPQLPSCSLAGIHEEPNTISTTQDVTMDSSVLPEKHVQMRSERQSTPRESNV